MKTSLVVTITCPDRPGIVESVTEVVVAHGGNWEESRLARLGGDFAGIFMVSVSPDRSEELAQALAAMTNDEINVTVRDASPMAAPRTPPQHLLCALRVEGADHEGIVHDVSEYLAGQGINVESMATEVESAPMSATPLFHMEAELKVPPALTLDELTANLNAIGDELGVDIEVTPLPGAG